MHTWTYEKGDTEVTHLTKAPCDVLANRDSASRDIRGTRACVAMPPVSRCWTRRNDGRAGNVSCYAPSPPETRDEHSRHGLRLPDGLGLRTRGSGKDDLALGQWVPALSNAHRLGGVRDQVVSSGLRSRSSCHIRTGFCRRATASMARSLGLFDVERSRVLCRSLAVSITHG